MLAKQLLLGLALPAAAAVAVHAAWLLRNSSSGNTPNTWVAATGIGVGFLAGFVALFGIPDLTPKESWQWIAHSAAGLTIVAAVVSASLFPRGVGWSIAGAAVLATAWVTVPPWQESRLLWAAGLSCGMGLAGVAGYRLAPRLPRMSPAIAVVIAAFALSTVFERAATARFAQLAGVLGASASGCLLAARKLPCVRSTAGFAGLGTVLLLALAFSGYSSHVSNVPAAAFFLAALAPLMAWVGQLGASRRMNKWTQLAIDTIPVMLAAGIAIALAVAAS